MAVQQLETRLDQLWREWLQARDRAMTSNDIGDGIAASRAWSRWLAEFVPDGNAKRAVHAVERRR